VPPMTLFGLVLRVSSWAELIVSAAVAVWPLSVAVIVDVVFAPTLTVVTVNVAEVAPAAIVTDAGTVALEPLAVSVTVKPPAPAGLATDTVPVELAGPMTVVGLSDSVNEGIVTVRVAVEAAPPLTEAPIELVATAASTREVAVNVPLWAPAATVIVAGTVAAEVLLEVKLIVRPPVGAGLLIVTVPVELVPPATEVGLRLSPETVGAVTVKFPDPVEELEVAVMVTGVFAATADVVIAATPLVAPAAIVIDAGAVAAGELDDRLTTYPPGGAALEIVTVAEFPRPPTVEAFWSVTVETVGALTRRAPVTFDWPIVAPIFALVVVAIWEVVAVKVAELPPAGTLTEPGTWAAALSELNVTVMPPAGAAPFRVTVPVDEAPPSTADGDMTTLSGTGGRIGSANLSLTPQAVAVRFAVTLLVTGTEETAKVPVVDPDGTDIVAGTVQ
jgi:hypothetical protein